jgi:IS5 family transposase
MIDPRQPLAMLARRMPWQEIGALLAHQFARQVKTGKKVEDTRLFGPEVKLVGAGLSNAERARFRTISGVALDRRQAHEEAAQQD